jgi:eukaryotic-like serine/threonine-protein kinase
MEPEQFGDYTLVRCLAIGGMGELYLAQREGVAGFSKQLVVKRIRPELAGDAEFVEMFLNEGRLAAMLDHPNIVHIYELGQAEGSYFMAMEYVAGKNLNTVLTHNSGPLELSMALGMFSGICEGMAFAHDAIGQDGFPLNLVHRDINPQNVLISYSGTVKIADFGIAKAQLQQRKETQVGVLKGKFGYLSPEQARSGPVDRRSDIYTMGLLLFETTIGQPAIPGKSDTQLLYAAAEGVVQRPTDFSADYPPQLEQIYLRATAKDPAARYQTVKELQEDLLTFQLDHRLVITSSKLTDLMRQLFGAESTGERRLPTPARAAAASGTGQAVVQRPKPPSRQIRPSRPGLDPDEPGLHQSPTVMETPQVSQPQAGGSQPAVPAPARDMSEDLTQLSQEIEVPAAAPGLASAETRMLDRSQPLASEVPPALVSAETRMLDRSQPEVALGAPRTDPNPRSSAIPFQPPLLVEPEEKARSRWPVILISSLITLLLAGGGLYLFLLRPDLLAGLGLTGLVDGVGAVDGGAAPGGDAKGPIASPVLEDSGASADQGSTAAAPADGAAARRDSQAVPVAAEGGAPRSPDAGAVTSSSRIVDAGTTRRSEPRKNRIEIACKPQVNVFWHGRGLGQTPLVATLPPGKQRLTLRNRDLGIKVTRRITVPRRGVTARADLVVEQGILMIKVRPWAHVTVNGSRRGTTPFKPLKLYEGTYSVKLTNSDHGTHEAQVTIRPGETSRLVYVFK